MPDFRRTTCQSCKRPSDKVGPISWSGLCNGCGKQRAYDNLDGLVTHTGPAHDHWKSRLLASLGVGLLDRDPPRQ